MSLLYEKESYLLRGIWFNIYNELGPGHKESVYCNAFGQELIINKIPYLKEPQINLYYKNGEKIGNYRPDFIVWNKIIVEFKSVNFLIPVFEKQLRYYLKGSNYKLGFLVNFGSDKIQIIRKINGNL